MPEQFSPLRLFVTLLVLIFGTELVMMFALDYVPPEAASFWVKALVDVGLLTVISSLFIWRLFMRPLRLAFMSEAARAQAVMDTAAEGIITIDERGIIESFNRAAEHMFGYTAGEAVGRNVKMLMPEPHASEHDGHLARYLRTGEAGVIGRPRELPALRKDGTGFPVELNLAEIHLGGERRFTGIIRDITERKQADERFERLAHHDSLTGLPNRTLFYDRLQQAIALARRERHELALLYLDLDRFKAVNDSFGHDAGDELLQGVAERIRCQARESDTVARVGGDEFTVILPRITSREDVATVAGKIIDALSTRFDLSGRQQQADIGASIGIAIYPADAQDIDVLVKAADAAMYHAKQVGNSFRFCAA
jgi:diguanylate cyclase (GGDEF)-like protein/PAS domain S-box-containing protein